MSERVTAVTAPLKGQNALAPRSGERLIARRLATAFAGMSLVAVVLCGLLLVMLVQVRGAVSDLGRDEGAVRDGLSLALDVREHYIHEAHTVIEGDMSQMGRHGDWVSRIRERAASLAGRVPPSERWRVERVARTAAEIDRVFTERVVPSATAGDREALREAHGEAQRLSYRIAEDADAIVGALEARMAETQASTARASRLAIIAVAVGLLAIIALALQGYFRIRASVMGPLDRLRLAARRIGEGDLAVRVGDVGRGELATVAEAFDRMVEELDDHQRRLVAASRMAAIGQLAAGVAHEINNPIAVIRGYLRTMIPEARDAEQSEELRILDEEAAACQRIVEDMLAYARSRDLEVEVVRIDELLGETVSRYSESDGSAAGRILLDAREGAVRADPMRIRQVVRNLLRNALEVSPAGAAVELGGEPLPDGGYRVHVADRGPGIPADERERVFEPFYTQRAEGTGLGLALCQGIIRAHGGSIEIRDREGGGADMVVTLRGEPVVETGEQT